MRSCFCGTALFQIRLRTAEIQVRAGKIARNLGKDGLRHSFAFKRQCGKHRIIADAPKILRRDKQAVAVFFGQFDIERCLAQEGVVAQDTLAEAVDGIDGGVVELPDGGLEE
ncbi:exodeoxyribonuclease V, beta subunit domain protein [Neisseria meningitidis NM151]|nr:exodeoxyribonuclease V, beta subunit domain protein [Neisseria meningitidis NM151]